MAFCERLSEQLAVIATVDPTNAVTLITATDVFSMATHRRALFILQTGVTVGTGILCNIEEAPVVGMTGSAVILTRAAVDCTAADSQYLFEVSAEAMAAGNIFLRGRFTPTGASILSCVVLADVTRYHPATDTPDLGTVVSIQAAN